MCGFETDPYVRVTPLPHRLMVGAVRDQCGDGPDYRLLSHILRNCFTELQRLRLRGFLPDIRQDTCYLPDACYLPYFWCDHDLPLYWLSKYS